MNFKKCSNLLCSYLNRSKDSLLLRKKSIEVQSSRNIAVSKCSNKNKDDGIIAARMLDFDAASLDARGYHRFQKPYSPASNVEAVIEEIFVDFDLSSFPKDPLMKYKLLKECANATGHVVPNSLIHCISSKDSLISYYLTPVDTRFPLDMMKDIDLPKNVHVTYNYTRFHPDTDTMFGGATAFPESTTFVTDIRAKKKYPGYVAKKAPLPF